VVALISEMYRDGKRALPLKPPTAFIGPAWRPFVKDGDIDRRAYELCVFSELRNRLRACDVWVDRSRGFLQVPVTEAHNAVPQPPNFDLFRGRFSYYFGGVYKLEVESVLEADDSRLNRRADLVANHLNDEPRANL
jgi:hypothetical protein